jgi:hypothetical protein
MRYQLPDDWTQECISEPGPIDVKIIFHRCGKKGRDMSDMGGVDVKLRAKSITGGIVEVLEKIRKKKS